ncbi:hypothetical protein C5167_025155, partial [Papaver somniferum]
MEHHLLSSSAIDGFLDYMLDDIHASNHTNTSNQPELDKTTTEETDESDDKKSKKRPHGNRESVRTYRERKKVRQASIEDELNRMRIVNQQLLKRLQGLVALEQEVARFKSLLVDIRGRIKGELGSFPYKNPTKGIGVVPQNMPRPSTSVGACEDNNSGVKEFLEFAQQANV